MTSRSLRLRERLLWHAALLVGAYVSTSASVQAGCGGHATDGRHSLAVLTMGQDPDLILGGPIQAPKPCSGPSCRRAPVTPVGVPVSTTAPQHTDWPCLLESTVGATSDPFHILNETSTSHPLDLGLSVFHLPRLAPSAD
jgi:hypothetical protein